MKNFNNSQSTQFNNMPIIQNNPSLNSNMINTLVNNNNNNNNTNFFEYLSQSISNNIIQRLVNNNMTNQIPMNNFQINTNNNNDTTNKQSNIDIFSIEKYSHKKINKTIKEKESNLLNYKSIQYQNSLQQRKKNINKFLLNYRLNSNNTIQNQNNTQLSKKIYINKEGSNEINSNNNSNEKIELIGKKGLIDKINNKNFSFKVQNMIKDINQSKLRSSEEREIKVNKDLEINLIQESEEFDNEIFCNQNIDNGKEELKRIFLEEIFYQKNTAVNYEIPAKFFREIEMPAFGNCFYCCISYYLYQNTKNHNIIRKAIFEYISNNPEKFYIFFEGLDNQKLNSYTPKFLLEKYIEKNNIDGEYAGDMEYAAACKLYNIRIILFTRGYSGLNVFNIYVDNENQDKNSSDIYILFINENHFNYLDVELEDFNNNQNALETISNSIKNNLSEWEKIRKREYPLSLKWYP